MGIVNSNYSLSSLVSQHRAHYSSSLRHFGDLKPRGNSATTTVKGILPNLTKRSKGVILLLSAFAVAYSDESFPQQFNLHLRAGGM